MDCDGVVKGDNMIATTVSWWWWLDVVASAMVLVVVVVLIAGTTSGGGWPGMKTATTITTPGRNGDGRWRIASLPHSWTASEAAATITTAIAEAATQHPRV